MGVFYRGSKAGTYIGTKSFTRGLSPLAGLNYPAAAYLTVRDSEQRKSSEVYHRLSLNTCMYRTTLERRNCDVSLTGKTWPLAYDRLTLVPGMMCSWSPERMSSWVSLSFKPGNEKRRVWYKLGKRMYIIYVMVMCWILCLLVWVHVY